jgi:predicted TIM-barrel fold metal-dependent hydrolase
MYAGPVVDAHHHFWRKDDLPWLAGPPLPRIFGEYSAIRRDYTLEEFIAETRPCDVNRSVYVQANWLAERSVEEVRWVQQEAERNGFPVAIVGYADLSRPEVGEVLDRQLKTPGLRGIRQQLHWHTNPLYKFASAPDLFDTADWRRGLREVQSRGLLFELQVFAGQMAKATELASAFPDATFVLLHAGMLEDRSPQGWRLWRKGMRELAARENVCTKLSGLGTFERTCSETLWKPVVYETLEIFGAKRCLYGSNFPIEKLWTSYGTLFNTMRGLLKHLSQDEQSSIFWNNASRLYFPTSS